MTTAESHETSAPTPSGASVALAEEALARGDVDACVAHLSAAIRSATAAGDPCHAAMSCVRLGHVYANALGNLTAARAWYARASRLLADQPPCVEQGWVAVASIGCDVDDPEALLAAAELALDRARRFGDVELETKALADAGLAHVQAGRVREGMALLDEAMALACGPADATEATAMSVCSFFTACYVAVDFGRFGSWAELLRRRGLVSLEPGGPMFLSSHCDSVQAAMLVELGRWSEAEAILVRAKDAFEAVMHAPAWHPEIALADLRLRQGRFADAEALLLGKEQALQALLPAARLHLARGDHELAAAMAARGLRAVGEDRLRAVEILVVLTGAQLGLGDVAAALDSCRELDRRCGELDVPALQARAAAARAQVLAASGDLAAGIAALEDALARADERSLPWLRAQVLLDLAALRERSGQVRGAELDARAAAAVLDGLDVTLAPDHRATLERWARATPTSQVGTPAVTATLLPGDRWFTVTSAGSTVRLPRSKGLVYLGELLAQPGTERHVLDLVDRAEGPADPGATDRRALGDAGELVDARARRAYRTRIERLRTEIDDAMESGLLEEAEAKQDELDQLVRELARAFGLGGRDRRAASAVERARLNVTRALRAAIANITTAMPAAGAVLDRRVRTGTYCAYEPNDADEVRWIVQS